MSIDNWKQLFEVNFSLNSTETIILFTLDFHKAVVDEALTITSQRSRVNNLIVI